MFSILRNAMPTTPGRPIFVNDIPVFFESSESITHCMSVLHHDQGQGFHITLVEFPILGQFQVAWVHWTKNVGIHILSGQAVAVARQLETKVLPTATFDVAWWLLSVFSVFFST